MFVLGIERLLKEKELLLSLKGKRVGLLAHPASVDKSLNHSLDLLMKEGSLNITCAFGPQHGMRGEKQDNMIESENYIDPTYKIPVHSLYGEVRYPTDRMMEDFDVLLVDLQDVGCRIYTFITTLFYMLEACDKYGKELWVLDRPNGAGRPVEGLTLQEGFESFIGAAPIPMRHGLTLGEAAKWYVNHKNLNISYKVIEMLGYDIVNRPWPTGDLPWVNPSPNIPREMCLQTYPGTVMVEGTTLSEGRGTTIPLEVIGHPRIDGDKVVSKMKELAPQWLVQCILRPCFFEPTFQKHAKELCSGFQIHVDFNEQKPDQFLSYRLTCLAFKAIRLLYPEIELWKQPPYEYEKDKMPIDILSGSSFLREWVDDSQRSVEELENFMVKDENAWLKEREPHLIY